MVTSHTQGEHAQPDALHTIARYKIGYATDDWGMRSSTPSGIPDHAGAWVRYKDHIAALIEAQQPAPSAAVALSDDLRDGLVAISAAIADQDDRAAQAMLREILAAPQPSTTPPADSHPAPVLLSDEELCQIEEPYLLNFRIPLGGQYDFARAVEKAVLAKTYGTQAPQPSPAPQADSQPAPVEVADAMADSQYLAGVSAGWNAANADDPNAALQKLHESRAGYLKPLSAARAPALSAAPAVPNGDELRRIARSARTSASDDASPTEYVLAGWKAAMLTASTTPPAEQQAMTVIDAEQWEPCSPSWIARGGDCAAAPRVWNAATCNHWHPKAAPKASPQQEAQAPDHSLRKDALCQLAYCNGMKAGWNYCVDGNEVDFARAMEGVSEAIKVLRELRENAPQPAPAPLIARSLAEWHEEDGYVAWWAWNGREWAGEPAWIGTPNCEDWPGYHTHWTPHPEQPVCAALAAQGSKA